MYRKKSSMSQRGPRAMRSRYGHYVAPAAVGTRVITKTPALRRSPGNSFKVSNRENCFPVIAQQDSNIYSVVTFNVQPGLGAIFPLLSNTAKTFTRYKIKYCVDFVSNVGSSAPGTIFMAQDTNINENPPASVSQLMSYAGAVSSNVWSGSSFPSNRMMARANDKKLFTRYGSLGPDEDIKLYDTASIFVALSGLDLTTATPPGTVIGQLYINYECTFYDQRLETIIESNIFTYYSSVEDPALAAQTPISQIAETELGYVFGSGDIQYTGAVAFGPSVPPYVPGCSLVFPSQGFYLVLQQVSAEIDIPASAGAQSHISPQPFGDTNVNQMIGYNGSGCLISDPIDIQGIFSPTGSSLVTGQCLQIVQVFEAGTYLLGDSEVVGNAWVSKTIGSVAATGGLQNDTNETQIYANLNQGPPATTIDFVNWTIEVTQVDPDVAEYFYPGFFDVPMAKTSGEVKVRSVAHHQRHAAIRGLRTGGRHTNMIVRNRFKAKALLTASTSKAIIDIPSVVPEEPEYDEFALRKLSDKEYREHMERLFKARLK